MQNTKKKIEQLAWFIEQVERGKTCLLLSPNFVVMDWKSWEELRKKSEKKLFMFFDESAEITDKVWKILEKRLKTK